MNSNLSIGEYAKSVGFEESIIWKWVLDKHNITKKQTTDPLYKIGSYSENDLASREIPYELDEQEFFEDKEGLISSSNELFIKKHKKSYSYTKKAEIIHGFLIAKMENQEFSMTAYAEQVGIDKSIISKWIQDKNKIFEKAYAREGENELDSSNGYEDSQGES